MGADGSSTPMDEPCDDRTTTDATAAPRLGRVELRPVLDELVRRYSAGDAPVRLTLSGLSLEQRTAVADLLGQQRLPRDPLRLEVAKLAAALGCSNSDELRTAVEQLRGPLPNRRAERAAADRERHGLWEWFDAQVPMLHLGGSDSARLREWEQAVRRDGVRGSVAEHRRRLHQVLAVLHELPADGVSLAALAGDVLHDPHGLDLGQPVARLVLSALAAVGAVQPPSDAEQVRSLWESAGVVPDPLSSTVLMLGVKHPMFDAATTGRPGDRPEPFVMTLSQLRRWPLSTVPTASTIFVVENPSLLAEAAMRLDHTAPPIICSSGQPSVAVTTALRQLGADGAQILQHADFDPAGIAICRLLTERVGSVPWLMTAAEYESAVRPGELKLSGIVPDTPWDLGLATLMNQIGRPAYEEQVRHSILDQIVNTAAREPRGLSRSTTADS